MPVVPVRPVHALVVGALMLSVTLPGILKSPGAAGSAPATARASSAAAKVSPGNRCERSTIDVPSCGLLWGIYQPKSPVPGRSQWAAPYPQTERKLGRRLDIVKYYVDWQQGRRFPGRSERPLAHHHRVLYFSWNPTNFDTHQSISYASIARGDWDKSVVRPEARTLRHFHHRVFIDFGHEFDSDVHAKNGTPRQFRAAFRHIENVMRQAHVHNVIWSWVSTGYYGNRAKIRDGYPGSRYVDWVGYDPYNSGSCVGQSWETPHQTMGRFYNWIGRQKGMAHKPILLSEYAASIEDARAGSWYAALPHALRKMRRIKAMIQFSGTPPQPCTYALTRSATAFAGFAKAANSRVVSGS